MGRPRKELDAEQVYKLARLGCTREEIADVLGCHIDTLRDRFSSEIARAHGDWKMSLRRAQTIRATKDKSDTMLIHLGKNYLGQNAGGTGQPPAFLAESKPHDDHGNEVDP